MVGTLNFRASSGRERTFQGNDLNKRLRKMRGGLERRGLLSIYKWLSSRKYVIYGDWDGLMVEEGRRGGTVTTWQD